MLDDFLLLLFCHQTQRSRHGDIADIGEIECGLWSEVGEGGVEPNEEAIAGIEAFLDGVQHACQIVGKFLSTGVVVAEEVLVVPLENSNCDLIIQGIILGYGLATLAVKRQCGRFCLIELYGHFFKAAHALHTDRLFLQHSLVVLDVEHHVAFLFHRVQPAGRHQ